MLPRSSPLLCPASLPLLSLMETSFTADSKRVCGVAGSSARGFEISAERIELACSGQRRATADI